MHAFSRFVTGVSFIFLMAVCGAVASATNRDADSDSLCFYVQLPKHLYLRCEPLWAFVVVKNCAQRPLNIVFPNTETGIAQTELIESARGAVSHRGYLHVIRTASFFENNSRTVSPGDSLVSLIDFRFEFGQSIEVSYCLDDGQYRASVAYLPNGNRDSVRFSVIEPKGEDKSALEKLELINRNFRSWDPSQVEHHLDEFQKTYPNSVYAPEVMEMKATLFKFTKAKSEQRLSSVAHQILEQFPDHPIVNGAIYDLLRIQSSEENRTMLDNLVRRRGTLVSALARQKLESGVIERLSREADSE